MANRYPRLVIRIDHLRENAQRVVQKCSASGIRVSGVIKGAAALIPCVRAMAAGGCSSLASSRLEQLEDVKKAGIKAPLLLLRVPMLSEVDDVVRTADCSLNSDLTVLRALNDAAARIHVRHHVIVMADVGDLREGFWDKQEMTDACAEVEQRMGHLELSGVGINIGCYGSLRATPEKLGEIVAIARRVEECIGRRLDIVSGGASSSYLRVLDGTMPAGINHLRIGEEILLPQDLLQLYGCPLDGMHDDVFTLEAEVIEVRSKPSYPVGELGFDAFGHKPVYIDKGIRQKALLAMGHLDYGDFHDLDPVDKGIEILGCSSDHTIVDVTDSSRDYHTGDIMRFHVNYGSNLFLCHSRNVRKVFVDGEMDTAERQDGGRQ